MKGKDISGNLLYSQILSTKFFFSVMCTVLCAIHFGTHQAQISETHYFVNSQLNVFLNKLIKYKNFSQDSIRFLCFF